MIKKSLSLFAFFIFFISLQKQNRKNNEFSIDKYILVVALSTQKVVSQTGMYL
jgi:hypothetical protein